MILIDNDGQPVFVNEKMLCFASIGGKQSRPNPKFTEGGDEPPTIEVAAIVLNFPAAQACGVADTAENRSVISTTLNALTRASFSGLSLHNG